MPNGLYSSVLRAERQDRIRRRNLAAVIQVLLAIGCSTHLLIDQLLQSEPAQPVKCGENKSQFDQIATHHVEKEFQAGAFLRGKKSNCDKRCCQNSYNTLPSVWSPHTPI